MSEPGLPKPENFFDDGDDSILARLEPGENPEDYGLVEATDGDIESRIRADQQQSQVASRMALDDPNDFDIRLAGKPGTSTTSAPRAMYQSQNTGPKGVKRDYEIAKRNLQTEKRFDTMRSDRTFDRLTGQMTQFYISEPPAEKKTDIHPKDKLASSDSEDSVFGKDDDGFDSEEERLFEKMKNERIAAIQNSLPTFGEYYRVDTFEDFATLIKGAHELGITVVHVYQNAIPTCQSLHLTFELIAPQFPHVCFVRVRSDELFKDRAYSTKGLPTLLLYRGEQLFHSAVPATTEAFGGDQDPHPKKVVQWLCDKGCLRLPTGGLDALEFKDVQAIRALTEDREQLDGNEHLERGIAAKSEGNSALARQVRGRPKGLRKGIVYQVNDDPQSESGGDDGDEGDDDDLDDGEDRDALTAVTLFKSAK